MVGRADHRGERLWRLAESALADYDGLPPWKRQVLGRFLTEVRHGWQTYVHLDLPYTAATRPDVLLIGPRGVLALLLREKEPSIVDAMAAVRFAGRLFLGVRAGRGNVSEAVVRPVLVLPEGPSRARSTGVYLAVSASRIDQFLGKGERRLDRRDVAALAEHLEDKKAEYRPVIIEDERPVPGETAELLATEQIQQDRVDAALAGSFESWLTFLDDAQFGMVRRDYSGPARISGPAGTGKSVVALHRLVHLGKRTTGKLLFATYARNLPPIMARRFEQLAPELGERAEFLTLHAWAMRFLQQRGIAIEVDAKGALDAFSKAWLHVGKYGKLNGLNPNPNYWWDEIDRVIKGRGLREIGQYQSVQRTGRGMRLERGPDRELVWDLYRQYERILADKGKHDFNDVFGAAVAEILERPLERPYAAVVVDEVQDITLIGLRLLHAISGDGPNRLLLVGDGQQQIYPGGWRLSDAGIPVRGRGEVLRNNYRNGARILELAQRFDASNQVDDLDGAVGVSLREVVATLPGGTAVPWHGPRTDHQEAVLAALRALDELERDDIAVLTFDHQQARHWRSVFGQAGIPVRDLDKHVGERDGTVKVGTVFRAKGLEFRAVVVPELARPRGDNRSTEWQERGQRACLVALTRARDHLWVGFPEPA